MSKAKILTIDIESSPIEAFVWGLFEQNVGLPQIKTEWTILSYAAKWLGKREIFYADTSGRGADLVRDDSVLMTGLWELLDEADIVVAQNGKKFDIKKINARLIMHGHGPYSPVRVVDTLLVARKYFSFTSNKLEWLSEKLTDSPKSKHRKFPGFELWTECLKDNPKAWVEMRKYNIQDIRSTELVYLKQRPWIANHPNLGAYETGGEHSCPSCGSTNIMKNGFATLQQGRYQRFSCRDCGSQSRGKQSLILPSKRKTMRVSI